MIFILNFKYKIYQTQNGLQSRFTVNRFFCIKSECYDFYPVEWILIYILHPVCLIFLTPSRTSATLMRAMHSAVLQSRLKQGLHSKPARII
jgi:hypothetical protein